MFFFTFILNPLGVLAWWIDPLIWGPPWSYVTALILTILTPLYIYEYVTGKYRG